MPFAFNFLPITKIEWLVVLYTLSISVSHYKLGRLVQVGFIAMLGFNLNIMMEMSLKLPLEVSCHAFPGNDIKEVILFSHFRCNLTDMNGLSLVCCPTVFN